MFLSKFKIILTAYLVFAGFSVNAQSLRKIDNVKCANLIYAGTKSSVCFADRFLTRVATETTIPTVKKFTPVKLASKDLFLIPFAVISGESSFRLTAKERVNLHKYLTGGGFLLASPGCSNKKWDKSFRAEIKKVFPEIKLKKIPMSHPIFSTVYKIPKLTLKHGGKTFLEGLEYDGRIVLIYSKEGLNDVKHAKGCCCCGGDQINQCERVNVNIFSYALLH